VDLPPDEASVACSVGAGAGAGAEIGSGSSFVSRGTGRVIVGVVDPENWIPP
jgi:hypothetical protein